MVPKGIRLAKTYSEQLAEVEAAITKATGAQRWQQGQRSEERADLSALFAERSRLERLIARQTRGGIRMRQGVPLG